MSLGVSLLLLIAVVVALFFLAALLFNRLETDHPDKYAEMGQPSFSAPTPANVVAALKFVFRREHKDLNDSRLSNLSDAILVGCILYIVLFACVFSAISATGGWRKPDNAT